MCDLDAKDPFVRPVFLVRADRDTRTLRVFGELDACSTPELLRVAADNFPTWMTIAVCLESLTFIDAAGLGGLVTVRERHRFAGGSLSVTHASPWIARVFALGELAEMFETQAAPCTAIVTRSDRGLSEPESVDLAVVRPLRSA